MLSGRVGYKLCAHNYNCVKCPYDQMIDDEATRLNTLLSEETGYSMAATPVVRLSGIFTAPCRVWVGIGWWMRS